MSFPLAEISRPTSLDQIVGQKHILNESHWITNLSKFESVPNIIIYGPPGTGKTTLAKIISQQTNKKFFKLNATSSSIADIKEAIQVSCTLENSSGVIIYLDEIQYFNKKQQQSLLEFMENGQVTLIASTTENPYFSIYPAILSRSQIVELKPVEKCEIKRALLRACKILETKNNLKISISEEVLQKIATLSSGDVRKAINTLEICFLNEKAIENKIILSSIKTLKSLEENSFLSYSKDGDDHFNLLSAFQKSLRGSDPDASIYYLARLLQVGEINSICRRLLICTCEDVGLANPQIINTVKSLTDIAAQVGLPEARIPLANAVLLVALSPKSNSTYNAINDALNDLKNGLVFPVPEHLRNVKPSSLKNHTKYLYPHDYSENWVKQDYLPSELTSKKYYHPQNNKYESAFANYWENKTHKKL